MALAFPLSTVARARGSTGVFVRSGLVEGYVRTPTPKALAEFVEASGGITLVKGKSVLNVRVSSSLWTALKSHPLVLSVESPVSIRPALDAATIHSHLTELRVNAKLRGIDLTGKGVLIGMVDFGVDVAHIAFADAAGNSRILAVWDQTDPSGPAPEGHSTGTFCDAAVLKLGGCQVTGLGAFHGTHVTAIAAGRQVDSIPYGGVAPGAGLALVTLGTGQAPFDPTARSTQICEAVAWIFEQARLRAMPAVINLSLSTQLDPHDGTSLANVCLDELTGPGRIIVAAAGNQGNGLRLPDGRILHAHGEADLAGSEVIFQAGIEAASVVRRLQRYGGGLVLRGVVAAEPSTLPAIALELRDGAGNQIATPLLGAGDGKYLGELTLGENPVGPLSIECVPAAVAGPTLCKFSLDDGNGDALEAALFPLLKVQASGHFDTWMDPGEGAGFLQSVGGTVNDAMTVGYPASGTSVLSVGSYVSRTSWLSAAGELQMLQADATGANPTVGSLSPFSGRGPLRGTTRRAVPDLLAPGQAVVSALATGALVDHDPSIVVASPDGYAAASGTSMASAFFAGVVALVLERCPTLDPATLRAFVTHTTRQALGDVGTSQSWGAGLLDASALLGACDPSLAIGAAGSGVGGGENADDSGIAGNAANSSEPASSTGGTGTGGLSACADCAGASASGMDDSGLRSASSHPHDSSLAGGGCGCALVRSRRYGLTLTLLILLSLRHRKKVSVRWSHSQEDRQCRAAHRIRDWVLRGS